MDNKLFKKRTVLPMTLFCSALMFSPMGIQKAQANVNIVQQGVSVKGNVVDSNGEPVIGASVLIVGGNATQGTVTDMDGNFTLNVKPGAQLKITYVGCVPQTVVAKNGMVVTLKDEATSLKGNHAVTPYI